MTEQELIQRLNAGLQAFPALQTLLKEVTLNYVPPVIQWYVARPSIFEDPNGPATLGAKVRYISKEGELVSYGQLLYVGPDFLTDVVQRHPDRIVEILVNGVGTNLVREIRKAEESKKPLPIKEFTPADREALQERLPF